jgi:hypothetical protein
LIRWEYQRRWKRGERVSRNAYCERFPQHATALQDVKLSWNCPRCHQMGPPLDEQAETVDCPHCGARWPSGELFPPSGDPNGQHPLVNTTPEPTPRLPGPPFPSWLRNS